MRLLGSRDPAIQGLLVRAQCGGRLANTTLQASQVVPDIRRLRAVGQYELQACDRLLKTPCVGKSLGLGQQRVGLGIGGRQTDSLAGNGGRI
jgi:hypothetical protein